MLQIHFEFACFYFVLIHLELKRQIRSYTPQPRPQGAFPKAREKRPGDEVVHSRSSLENHARFQTKMSKVYTRFNTKQAQKTILYRLYEGVSLPPPPHPSMNLAFGSPWGFSKADLL